MLNDRQMQLRWPPNLLSLTLGTNFNHSLQAVKLPVTLESFSSTEMWRFPCRHPGTPSELRMVYFRENPIYEWMRTGGTPYDLGNHHVFDTLDGWSQSQLQLRSWTCCTMHKSSTSLGWPWWLLTSCCRWCRCCVFFCCCDCFTSMYCLLWFVVCCLLFSVSLPKFGLVWCIFN